MSEAPPPAFTCGTCHRLLSVKICKSNKNGNTGRVFTCCYKKHNNGTHCSFFAWVDARLSPPPSRFASSSPPSSPTQAPATFSIPLSAQIATQSTSHTAPSATSNLSSSTSGFCTKRGKNHCKSTRIHPECNRQMCRRHCIDAGGCRVKGHGATDKGKQRAMSPLSPSPSSTPPREIHIASTSTTVDMFADPRHASQMTAAFTKHYAIQQTLEEQRRAVDAERIANIEKAKHNVIVYAWPKVCPLRSPCFKLFIN